MPHGIPIPTDRVDPDQRGFGRAGGEELGVAEIDQRSDVYAVGAILYELLTLCPPVDREGGSLAVLKRVVNGEIDPPERRAPRRVRQGLVPGELSAICSLWKAPNTKLYEEWDLHFDGDAMNQAIAMNEVVSSGAPFSVTFACLSGEDGNSMHAVRMTATEIGSVVTQ